MIRSENVEISHKAEELDLEDQYANTNQNKNTMFDWILNRLGEKSTWRGIITVLGVAGISWSPEQTSAIVTLGVALVGAVEVFFKEPQSKDAK